MMRCLAILLVLVLFSGYAQAETQFIESPPLSKVAGAKAEACSGGGALAVPVITWGGDIATIYANGSQPETAKGSIFDRQGLKLRLFREDVFANQVRDYLSCQTPFLRGTMGMLNLAAEVTERDPATKMVFVYQLTWSAGGDAMVVKSGIRKPRDLKGKAIALQAYGPHIDYLAKILSDAGLSMKDVRIKWVKDLTGTENSPRGALYRSDIDAAMVIIPDALALTSNGTVGTGAEDSVKGARIMRLSLTSGRRFSPTLHL